MKSMEFPEFKRAEDLPNTGEVCRLLLSLDKGEEPRDVQVSFQSLVTDPRMVNTENGIPQVVITDTTWNLRRLAEILRAVEASGPRREWQPRRKKPSPPPKEGAGPGGK